MAMWTSKTEGSERTNQFFHSYLCQSVNKCLSQSPECQDKVPLGSDSLPSSLYRWAAGCIFISSGSRKKFFGGTSGKISTFGQSFSRFCLSLPRRTYPFSEGSDTHFIQDFLGIHLSDYSQVIQSICDRTQYANTFIFFLFFFFLKNVSFYVSVSCLKYIEIQGHFNDSRSKMPFQIAVL